MVSGFSTSPSSESESANDLGFQVDMRVVKFVLGVSSCFEASNDAFQGNWGCEAVRMGPGCRKWNRELVDGTVCQRIGRYHEDDWVTRGKSAVSRQSITPR